MRSRDEIFRDRAREVRALGSESLDLRRAGHLPIGALLLAGLTGDAGDPVECILSALAADVEALAEIASSAEHAGGIAVTLTGIARRVRVAGELRAREREGRRGASLTVAGALLRDAAGKLTAAESALGTVDQGDAPRATLERAGVDLRAAGEALDLATDGATTDRRRLLATLRRLERASASR